MNKLFKFFMFWAIPLLAVMVVSCKDDEVVDDPILPDITAVDPVEGIIGDQIIITGTGFDEVTEVRFGSVTATGAVITPTKITVPVPAGVTAGAQVITVTSPEGSDTFNFTVVPGLSITALDPVEGAPGDKIIITGTGLADVTTVMVGETPVEAFAVEEDGTISFTVPDMAPAVTKVTVSSPEGKAEFDFEVVEPVPVFTVTAIEPMEAAIGQDVVLTGTDLDLVSSLTVGGVEVLAENFVEVAADGTTLTFTVPEGATVGAGPIMLKDAGGLMLETADFTVAEAAAAEPIVFDPMVGPVTTVVTISGADFTGATAVRLGETDITNFTVEETGDITFAVPEGATSGVLTVTTPTGDLVSANQFVVGTPSAVYEEAVSPDWQVFNGWNQTNEPANTELGDNSIKIVYSGAWGGFQFAPASGTGPFPLTGGTQSVLISIYGGVGAGDVMLYIKPSDLPAGEEVADANKVTLDVVEGQWKTFLVPVSDLGNPTDIAELVVQNRDAESNTIYIDDIMIVTP